jgi:hypothetical protein
MVDKAERGQRRAMLLASVLRAWLSGDRSAVFALQYYTRKSARLFRV